MSTILCLLVILPRASAPGAPTPPPWYGLDCEEKITDYLKNQSPIFIAEAKNMSVDFNLF
jgi:hypothetical protein